MKLAEQTHLLLLVLGVFLPGCAVGPDYKLPQTAVAASFANSPTNAIGADEAALASWWKLLNDPKLELLIELAIAHNHDLRIATANLKEARALRRLTTFDLAPTVQANAGYDRRLLSKAGAFPGTPREKRELEFFDAGFDAVWELDLFGRVRRSVEAATAQVAATEADRLDVLVSVIAEVARNYLELRGQQNRLAVARKNAAVQQETLQITEDRLRGGRGTDFDVSRSRSLLNLTLSTIPPLEAEIQKIIHRLAVLTGQQPNSLVPDLSTASALPAKMPSPAVDRPDTVLRRRPDIRAAERSLAAATARVGIATADLFPRVSFIGSVGLQADTVAGLGQGSANRWNFGPRITWAALDMGRVVARIKAADARTETALAIYERTVLIALEETENALIDFGREQLRYQSLANSAQASLQAADLAHQRFEGGITDFLSVLDAERTLLESQDRLAASQTRTATAFVAVYKALGGGIPVK